MKNKRIFLVFLASILLLAITVCWEYVFDRQDESVWVRRFEKRLHAKELKAEEILQTLSDSVDIEKIDQENALFFVGYNNKQLIFWTNELVGDDELYDKLNGIGNFVLINNVYYEVRKRTQDASEYFVLIRIKDNYPYTNQYLKNRFASFLGIGDDDAQLVDISRFASADEQVIRDKDGLELFYIHYDESYKDRSANYFLLILYALVFLSFFYIYDQLLRNAASFRSQIFYVLGFVAFLFCLRLVLIRNSIPDSVFRLYLFDNDISRATFVTSIGDMLVSAFCVCQLIYITFFNIRIDFQSLLLKRLRYFFVCGFIVLAYLYLNFLNYGISSLIENTDVHLNIARVVYIGIPSVIAFIAIILVGLGLIVIIDSAVICFRNLLSFRQAVKVVCAEMLFLGFISYYFDLYTTFWDCLFWMAIFLLILVNRYLVKREVQRSLYMMSMFLLSVYIVLLAKNNEQYRELSQRIEYATELIEERDYNFEEKLREINAQIEESEIIADLIAANDEEMLHTCLTSELLEMTGYSYVSKVTLCFDNDSIQPSLKKDYVGCMPYFDELISRQGSRIGNTNFYSIVDFDGIISYIGRFSNGRGTLYLRFDSVKDSENSGYPQILSRESQDGEDVVYPYSYAKYKNGHLIFSSGEFNYYHLLSSLGENTGSIEVVEKDTYSHMLIPVDKDNVLVISLHAAFFTLYLVNILYAFFICVIIASYGLFFNLNNTINFRRGTLKARIKNGILFLIFFLFVILTVMSIYLNTKSFEERHNTKITEFLKFINKELEPLNCIDEKECPEIYDVLKEISEILSVDVNIYSTQGQLLATSRPEIFGAGFDGSLINPVALKKIVREGSMSYVEQAHIGELGYMSAYMPLVLKNGEIYVLNVPYFTQNDELNLEIIIMVIIAINIAIFVMILAFILSGIVADRVTKPLQMVNDRLRQMRFGGRNEQIEYTRSDELGALVKEYNNMVAKLDESVRHLARSEREGAWREMARQVAHEIKNPLTPMKLNIQFMQRSLLIEDKEQFRERFKDIAAVLIEQIDNMAAIASAFSDFAKMPVANNEVFDLSEVVINCARLFEKNVNHLDYDIEPGVLIFADKDQMQRVIINLLKNSEQSIPPDREGVIGVSVRKHGKRVVVFIKDNGSGISEELRHKIFEPNFTTKTSGTGLGLAISRKIIESMGGTIDYTSMINEGTEFFITLDCV